LEISNNIESRLIELEKVAHAPQNYRQRCKVMENKVDMLEREIIELKKMIKQNGNTLLD